jgi:hypothetical protein
MTALSLLIFNFLSFLWYEGQLKVYYISSRGESTSGGPLARS